LDFHDLDLGSGYMTFMKFTTNFAEIIRTFCGQTDAPTLRPALLGRHRIYLITGQKVKEYLLQTLSLLIHYAP